MQELSCLALTVTSFKCNHVNSVFIKYSSLSNGCVKKRTSFIISKKEGVPHPEQITPSMTVLRENMPQVLYNPPHQKKKMIFF